VVVVAVYAGVNFVVADFASFGFVVVVAVVVVVIVVSAFAFNVICYCCCRDSTSGPSYLR